MKLTKEKKLERNNDVAVGGFIDSDWLFGKQWTNGHRKEWFWHRFRRTQLIRMVALQKSNVISLMIIT